MKMKERSSYGHRNQSMTKRKNLVKLTYFLKTGKSGAMTGILKVIALINNGGKPCTS